MMYYPGMSWCMVSVKLTSCYKKGACFFLFTELQNAKEEGKQMNSVKVSYDKLLQNERTLKIQVCVWMLTIRKYKWSELRCLVSDYNCRREDQRDNQAWLTETKIKRTIILSNRENEHKSHFSLVSYSHFDIFHSLRDHCTSENSGELRWA